MKVYCISGLGANEHIYDGIKLDHEKVTIRWASTDYTESMHTYAQKLSQQINTSEPYALVGLSLGGMLAVEMNKFLNPVKTIIISSAACRKELPMWVRFVGVTRLHRLIPSWLYLPPSWLVFLFSGAKSSERKKRIKKLINSLDARFIKQCVDKIVRWDNQDIPNRLVRIHGTKDMVLYPPKHQKCQMIANTGHLAIIEKSSEISRTINNILSTNDA